MPEQLSNVLRGNVLASTLIKQLRLRGAIFWAGTEKGAVHNLSGEQSDAEPKARNDGRGVHAVLCVGFACRLFKSHQLVTVCGGPIGIYFR